MDTITLVALAICAITLALDASRRFAEDRDGWLHQAIVAVSLILAILGGWNND